MENVLLIIHLILALALIGVVLLQRSEGGGLGIGGGGGGGLTTGRSSLSPLAKLTWALAIAFICTSITLTIFAAANSTGGSVLDRISDQPDPGPAIEQTLPSGEDLLPPPASTDPLLPPRAE